MKVVHPSKFKVLVIALNFGSVMVLAQARQAYAYDVFLLAAALAVTYATVMGVACTPIAASKASDYPGGFSGAFGDCFWLEMEQTAPAEEKDDAPKTEEEEESPYRDYD